MNWQSRLPAPKLTAAVPPGRYHPDKAAKGGHQPDKAAAKFRAIQESYEVLADEVIPPFGVVTGC